MATLSQEGATFKFNHSDSKLPGVCVEIMREIEKIDPDIKFSGIESYAPIKRVEILLENNEIDVFFGLLKNETREKVILFPENGVLYEIKHQVAVLKEESVVPKTLEELKTLSLSSPILATLNTSFVKFLTDKGINLDNGASSHEENIKKLLIGRGRYFYSADSNFKVLLNNPKYNEKIKVLDNIFFKEKQYVVFSKKVSIKNQEKILKALEKMQKEKIIEKILSKYE